mgnify:FL=1
MQESTYNFEDNLKNVVYTSDKLVNNMLQSVQDEIERIDSRVLEPSCGDGNFLDAILRKKLFSVCKKYGHSRVDFEFYILRALMSLYGVEIDNSVVILCKQRLELSVKQFYLKYYTEKQWIVLLPLVQYILDTNILCGDSLSLTSPIDGSPVVLAEWSFLGSYKVKRRDFVYEQLIDVSESAEKVLSDRHIEGFIPKPVKDYPLVKIFNIRNYAKI